MNQAAIARSSLSLLEAMQSLPLIAILRGIHPQEVRDAALSLYAAGFRIIEIPLNSPSAFTSLEILRDCLPSDALHGAGTVLRLEEVFRLHALGAKLVVMPHADREIIQAAKAAGMICIPGVSSLTEAFAALSAGADGLKLYPAELISSPVLKSMRAVLPSQAAVFPVGGIDGSNMSQYLQAGASGFGIGGSLYRPGMPLPELALRAQALIQAYRNAMDELHPERIVRSN
jgi:2-dehydro-3-deoxyphosphogalactonate aldolase